MHIVDSTYFNFCRKKKSKAKATNKPVEELIFPLFACNFLFLIGTGNHLLTTRRGLIWTAVQVTKLTANHNKVL